MLIAAKNVTSFTIVAISTGLRAYKTLFSLGESMETRFDHRFNSGCPEFCP